MLYNTTPPQHTRGTQHTHETHVTRTHDVVLPNTALTLEPWASIHLLPTLWPLPSSYRHSFLTSGVLHPVPNMIRPHRLSLESGRNPRSPTHPQSSAQGPAQFPRLWGWARASTTRSAGSLPDLWAHSIGTPLGPASFWRQRQGENPRVWPGGAAARMEPEKASSELVIWTGQCPCTPPAQV